MPMWGGNWGAPQKRKPVRRRTQRKAVGRCSGSTTYADYVTNGGLNQCPVCGRMVYIARDGRVAVH